MPEFKADKIRCPFGGAVAESQGDPASPLVIVGEAPGIEEQKAGIPFVGPSGEILWKAYGPREGAEPYVINAYNCRYRKKASKKLLNMARAHCQRRMWDDIERHERKLIIALGNEAMALIANMPREKVKITKIQGKTIKVKSPYSGKEYTVFPIIHPAAILRGSGSLTQFNALMAKAKGMVFAKEDGSTPSENKRDFSSSCFEFPDYSVVKIESEGLPQSLLDPDSNDPNKPKLIAADIETSSLKYYDGKILCIGLSDGKTTTVVPWHPRIRDILQGMLISGRFRFIWHNGQFDIKFLHQHGVTEAEVHEDTMLMSYALDERPGYHDLGYLGSLYVGAEDFKEILDGYLPNKKTSYEVIPKHILYKYQAADAFVTRLLYDKLLQSLRQDKDLVRLYREHLIPSTNMLAWVEENGLFVYEKHNLAMKSVLEQEIEQAKQEIHRLAGYPVNPNSPDQVKYLLYKRMGIRTKRQDTRKETLAKLTHYPVVRAILKYRKAAKLYSTYVKKLLDIRAPDGRVHPSFKLHGTVTGRLASADPNVQNIPRRKDIRAMYGGHPDNWILEVDLDQAELRVLAILSQDPDLIRIYTTHGMSLHDEVALAMYGEGYTGDQRIRAKAVNFGIVYGRTAHTLAEEFEIPLSEGQALIDAWFERFPKAGEFIKSLRRSPIEGKVITTPFGRKRRFQTVTHERLDQIQNEASNFPHQSIASDIVLKSACNLRSYFQSQGVKIINLVHDAMLVEIPSLEMAPEIYGRIKEEYINVGIKYMGDSVLFESDCKVGKQWGYSVKTNFQDDEEGTWISKIESAIPTIEL